MAPKELKISKQAAAGTTRHITFRIPETLGIIMKPGSATFQSVIMAAYGIGLLAICGIKKQLVTGFENICTYETLPSCAHVSKVLLTFCQQRHKLQINLHGIMAVCYK